MDCGIFVKYIGYREAPSEEACVEELKEREPELEIISLLDYHLPGMTGRRELSAEADTDLHRRRSGLCLTCPLCGGSLF